MKKFILLLVMALVFSSSTVFAGNGPEIEAEVLVENMAYDEVRTWGNNDLIYVRKNGYQGCINQDGEVIIPLLYREIQGQNDFLLAISYDNSYTLLDKNGNIRMDKSVFEKVLSSGGSPDSLLMAENILGIRMDTNHRLVNFNGEDIPGVFSRWVSIEENLIKEREDESGVSYYLGSSGKQVLPKEDGITYTEFSDELVLKARLNPENRYLVTPLGFYDAKGELIFEVPEFANAEDDDVSFSHTGLATLLQFSEGLAAYKDKTTGLIGFLDKSGHIAIPAAYERCVLKFQNGVATVYLPGDDKMSYINTKGELLFSIAEPSPWPRGNVNGIYCNYYTVENEDEHSQKTVAQDEKGNILFSDKSIFIDGEVVSYAFAFGTKVAKPSETMISINIDSYSRSAVFETKNRKLGLLDLKGNIILKAEYEEIIPLQSSGGRLLLKKDGVCSIIKMRPTATTEQELENNIISLPIKAASNPLKLEGSAKWQPNAPNISTYYNAQVHDMFEIYYNGYQDLADGDNFSRFENMHLLMVNGGFVPHPDIIIKNNRTMVPTSVIEEVFGAAIDYNEEERTVKVTIADINIVFHINTGDAVIDGKPHGIDASVFFLDSKIYVPLRFIADTLDADIQYKQNLLFLFEQKLPTFRKEFLLDLEYFDIVTIETDSKDKKAFTVEDGVNHLKIAATEMYGESHMVHTLGNDYDMHDFKYTDHDLGRYYIYVVKGFENEPVYFNKYTGEIFSSPGGSIPYFIITSGFLHKPVN